jgi:pimeloyl-ACP methyl ester carboxylesterase
MLHGAASTRTAVLDEAVELARRGYGVLLFDARGHGLSEGRAMDYGWWGETDTAAAVSYLTTRGDVDPGRIGAVGLSMGGEQAIGALAVDPRLRAVVAEGATGRTAADNAWLSEVYGRRGVLQERIDVLRYAVVDLLTDAPRPPSLRESAGAAAPRPILLIAAGEVPDERSAAEFIRSGAPRSVALWEVPGARHIGGLATASREWRERVTAFLDAALAPPAPPA